MNSKYQYVRSFERDDKLLLNSYFVVRIDGKGFHRFSTAHSFEKPNDKRALSLMNHAAALVMRELGSSISLAFGQSDEYSFLFDRKTTLYNRRGSKITSHLVSVFSASFVLLWKSYFPSIPLKYPPSFDARVVLYPTVENVKDYFAWRQTDTHINNLYNTTFWSLVKGGKSTKEAHEQLMGTVSSQKNEILFHAGLNYNTIDPIYRKGSLLLAGKHEPPHDDLPENALGSSPLENFQVLHVDCISSEFWSKRPHILDA